jgi:hypothetical protein
MKLEWSKEWCIRMAQLEADAEIGAGLLAFDPTPDERPTEGSSVDCVAERIEIFMKYEIHSVKDDEGNLFHCVYETATDQPIDFFYFLEDAQRCQKFLESGGAFDGFTPSFMLINFTAPKTSENLNAEFKEAFE